MSRDNARTRRSRSFAEDASAASEVVAVALLIGIVVLGVVAIVLVGNPQLGESQKAVEVGQAEQALTQFDSEATRVATGSTSSRMVDLGLRGNRGTLDTQPESGNITIESVNALENGDRTEIVNTSLGTVIYENGDTTVGYQGGGVWRSDGDGSVMISPPEITFRDGTLTMHFIKGHRGGSVHSDVQLSRFAPSEQKYPSVELDLENKVEGATIEITIESRYYRAWGQYFEDEADTIVQYDHETQTVVIQFLALPMDYAPEAGVVATSGPGEIRLEGTGAYIDSYDSTVGTYEETRDTEGTVRSAGEVKLFGDGQIDGDVEADRDISVNSGSSQIDGNASSRLEVYEHDDESVTGVVRNNSSGVPSIPPIDRLVEHRVDGLASDNDNDATDAIVDDRLDFDGDDELTITAGEYYLENIDLHGETLVLDTTDGNVTIAVETWVKVLGDKGQESHIEIEGDGEVRLFVKSAEKTAVNIPGEGGEEVHFYVKQDATITTVGDDRERSTQFLVFAPSHFEGAIAGSSSRTPNMTGVIVAPAGLLGTGDFYVKQGELYGAVMTGNLTLGQNGEVHFDHALRGKRIPLSPNIPRLEYLYVTQHEIEVRSS